MLSKESPRREVEFYNTILPYSPTDIWRQFLKGVLLMPPLVYVGEVWEGVQPVLKELGVVQIGAVAHSMRCVTRTSYAAATAELGMYLLRAKRKAEECWTGNIG